MAKDGEEVVQNEINSENQNADSNSSDNTYTGIRSKSKKKSLTDMLKKLHDGNNHISKPEIPSFLQKDGTKDQEASDTSVNDVKTDSNFNNIVKKTESKDHNDECNKNKDKNNIENNIKDSSSTVNNNKVKNNENQKSDKNNAKNNVKANVKQSNTTTSTSKQNDDSTKKQQQPGKQPSSVGHAKVSSLKTNTDIYKCSIDGCKSSFSNTNDFQTHISSSHPHLESIPCCFCYNNLPSKEYFPHLSSHIKNVMKCLYCQVSHDTREELLKHLTEIHANQPKKINVCIRILNNLRGKKSNEKGLVNKPVLNEKNNVSANKNLNSNSSKIKDNTNSNYAKMNNNDSNKGKIDDNNNDQMKVNNEKESNDSNDKNLPTDLNSLHYTDIKPPINSTANQPVKSEINQPVNSGINQPVNSGINQPVNSGINQPINSETSSYIDFKSVKTDQTTKSRNRKSLKPVKSQQTQSSLEDKVEIRLATDSLSVVCEQCTFTCVTESSMKQHCVEVHKGSELSNGGVGLFQCKHCRLKTDLKDEFLNHLAHHKLNNQVVRLYACPYCPISSNSMDKVEDHIDRDHPSESFKFEVSQENTTYLQNLLICPVCSEAYQWKDCFLKHVQSTHELIDLVTHLSAKFQADLGDVKSLSVPKSYFKNLLPYSPDYYSETNKTYQSDKSLIETLLNPKKETPKGDSNSSMEVSFDHPKDQEEGKKSEGLLTDHPLLYNMLSKTPTPSSSTLVSQPAYESPVPLVPKKDYVEYTDRFPPGDLVKYVIKKSVPTIFNCNLCPFECSKTTHFRRHLEIHKRNESLKEGYKCGHCEFMHYRLNCIRFHLGKYHSNLPYKIYRIINDSQIILGVDDDPTLKKSKAKNPFLASTPPTQPSTSTPLQRPERERRPPAKLETDFSFHSQSIIKTGNPSMDEILLFERHMPSSMIFPEPIQCPKCDFSNRVRINILKHLKLHKEVIHNSSITSPAPLESEEGSVEVLKNVTMSYITRANLSEEYHQFSVKIPNHNHYKCKECNFTHRYPSKVKRHFYYKHAATFPYKCGYCSFGAVEGGKVRRHCKLMHPSQSEMVIKRNVYKRASDLEGSPMVKRSKLELEDTEEEGVKVRNEWMSAVEASEENLWLPQFVTVLEDDVKCCKLCGFQQEGTSSLKDHVLSSHLETYPYSCSCCGFALMDIARIKKHFDAHHPDHPYAAVKRHSSNDESQDLDESQESTDLANDESSQSIVNESQLGTEDDSQLGTEKDFEDEDGDVVDDNQDEDKDEMKNFLYESLTMIPHEADKSYNGKKRYKCHYCGVVSKWNRRDIRLHILHVHMKKKVYTCKHCGFGNSKSKVVVRSHCLKVHPDKSIAVKDDLVLFNSIVPLEDSEGIVTMVMCNKEGNPILTIPQDEDFDVKLIYNQRTPSKSNLNTPKAITTDSPKTGSQSSLKSDRWKCKQCTYASTSEADVKYHIISLHLNIRPFSCPHCHVYINKEDLVIAHIDKYHPDKERSVVDTLQEKSEYLQAHMECLLQPTVITTPMLNNADEDVIDEGFAKIMEQQTNPRYSSGYFRCMLCGYRDPRNDKTKYHIIKTHLNLRQFSCPYCSQYMWGRQQVMSHIQEEHPGKEVVVKRTFHQYDEFLRKNIKKFPYNKNLAKVRAVAGGGCVGNGGGDSSFVSDCSKEYPNSLVIAPEMKNKLFQCFYCEFKNALVAKIQSHCLEMHPSDFVRFKQVDVAEDEFKNFSEDEEYEGSEGLFKVKVADGDKKGTFICQHCELVKWTEKDMTKHLLDLHQDENPSYTFVSSDLFSETVKGEEKIEESGEEVRGEVEPIPLEDDDEEYFPTKKMSIINARQNNAYINAAGIKMTNVANTKFSHMTSNDLLKSKASLYQCKLCAYKSNKMTVMRHHVMSHLRYHPYVCPYCNIAKSVKSFPVKKHVISKHPGKEVKALHCVDREVEKKISNSYFKMKVSSMGVRRSDLPSSMLYTSQSSKMASNYNRSYDAMEDGDEGEFDEENMDEEMDPNGEEDNMDAEMNDDDDDVGGDLVIDTSESRIEETVETSKDTTMDTTMDTHKKKDSAIETFKCKFCTFKSSVKSTMKHHLMKELNYKPFKCQQCHFRDTTRPSLSKHSQIHHPDKEVKVTEERNQEKEVLVLKMLEECVVSTNVETIPEKVETTVATAQGIPAPSKQPIQISKPSLFPMIAKDSKVFKCPECDYTNSSLKLVRGHMVKHGPYRLKCAYCDYKAHYPSRIRKHNRRQHHGKVAKCLKVVNEDPPAENKAKIPLVVMDKEDANSDEEIQRNNRTQPHAAGQVYLDGVPIDLPLVADTDGWFRCQFCRYESLNRDNFKVHLVTHKPPRWKCFHCEQKYPVVFRVRRHCNLKHPNLPVKWVDVQTKKVRGDLRQTPNPPVHTPIIQPNKLTFSINNPLKALSLMKSPKARTARKSSLPSYRQIRMVKKLQNMNESLNKGTNLGENTAEEIKEATEDCHNTLSVWKSASLDAKLYRYCCHLCSFCHVSTRPDVLFTHLKIEHHYKDLLPVVEILPRSEEAEVWALKRCGFCLFESYDSVAFKKHVMGHTHCQPVQCIKCAFASFSGLSVAEHFVTAHAGDYEQMKEAYMKHGGIGCGDDNDIDSDEDEDGDNMGKSVDGNDNDDKLNDDVDDKLKSTDTSEKKKDLSIAAGFFHKRLSEDYTMITENDGDVKQVDCSGNSTIYIKLTVDYSLEDYVYNESDDGNSFELDEDEEEEDEDEGGDDDDHNSDNDDDEIKMEETII